MPKITSKPVSKRPAVSSVALEAAAHQRLADDVIVAAARTEAPDDRAAFAVDEFCRMLGISRTTFYQLVAADQVATFKLGNRRLVPAAELHRILATAKPGLAA